MRYTDTNWTLVYAMHVLRQRQDNRCAICHEPKRLAVDHDHASGEVRGLLCYSCNIATQRHENRLYPIHDERVADYLADPPARDLATPTHADRMELGAVIADQPWVRPYHITRVLTATAKRSR